MAACSILETATAPPSKAGPARETILAGPPLPLPPNVDEPRLLAFLGSVAVAGSRPWEMAGYIRSGFRRIVHTYGLARELTGTCLELGANPYFATMLLRQFTQLELAQANFFGPDMAWVEAAEQEVRYNDFGTNLPSRITFSYRHFNVEAKRFPYEEGSFDVVLFCELLEHLLLDPVATLREIKRVLKPGGTLVLTTPNVNRLENVARMLAGLNVYGRYSFHGPYGRHNREYTKEEVYQLLDYLGFTIEALFTADSTASRANEYLDPATYGPLIGGREGELGQYIFVRARNDRPASRWRPHFLYQGYPLNELG